LTTKISLIIHVNELKRSSNTGRLALRALVNSEMRIRGQRSGPLDLKDLLTDRYRTLLLYPSANAVDLDRELVEQERTPIQLIVPDGTWRQAAKVLYRHPELKDVQRVKIGTPDVPKFHLRAQSRPDRTATLPAIAQALGILEGDLVRNELMKVYELKVERTLRGRGLLDRSGTVSAE
jgi:DTW domain-containing protein YfiP